MAPATCVPMKELKNTAEFTDTVQNAAGPVLVTKNGREAFVALSMSGYEALWSPWVPLRQRATCWTPSMALWPRSRRFR